MVPEAPQGILKKCNACKGAIFTEDAVMQFIFVLAMVFLGGGLMELDAMWQKLDAALVEIRDFPSVPDEATATRFGDSLKRQRAVGSFLSYYYNERGEFISGENDFAVRIPLGTLRHCPKIIGLALGAAPNAIIGALKTGLFTHLLVTESTARKILEK